MNEHGRHASWLELFFDLAYVGAIAQVANALAKHYDARGIAQLLLILTPIWWSWIGHTFYLNRFDGDDMLHRVYAFLQIAGAVLLAVHAPAAMEGDIKPFALTYAAIRTLLVVQYLVSALTTAEGRQVSQKFALGFGCATLVWIASLFVGPVWAYVFWGLGIVVDLATPLLMRRSHFQVPVDYEHMTERVGLFTIIVLGEGILAAVAGLSRQELPPDGLMIGMLGLLLAFGVWWIYFDGAKATEIALPRSSPGIARILVWLYLHLPLAAGIVIMAVGVKKAIVAPFLKPLPPDKAMILVLGTFLIMLVIHGIFFASLRRAAWRLARRAALPHFVITLAILPAGLWAAEKSSATLIATLATCIIALVALASIERNTPSLME